MAQIRRSRAEWLQLIDEWRDSGKSAERFCSKLGIRPATLKWWAWKIGAGEAVPPTASALVPVKVATHLVPAVATFELELGDVRLRFETGTDPRYVAALANALATGDATW